MPVSDNLVHQITTSTGASTITLSAVSGKQSFNDAFGTGGTDVFWYFIAHQTLVEWEVGSGHLSASNTLVRDTIIDSSNAGSIVTFSAGTKDVASDIPYGKLQLLGKHAIWIPASAFVPQTTSPAGYEERELATNDIMTAVATFDTAADENIQFSILWPVSLGTATVTFKYVWTHGSTATNFGVSFWLQALGRSDDDAGDTAMGTAVTNNDTGGTTDDIYISPESAAVTISTLASGDMVFFRLFRDVSDAGDTLAVDARVLGVMIYVTVTLSVEP